MRYRRAFTLIEMVVSVCVISIIMLGMGSVLLVATKALPNPERPAYKVNQTSRIADEMVAELQEARHIIEHTSTAFTFTVSDRDGNGSPERIRYAWSGTAGDPLTRQYNFGTEVTVLEDMTQFDLSYVVKTKVESYPGPPEEGEEILLSQYTYSKDLKDFRVRSVDWIGQYFEPSAILPPDTASWRVTRVRFEAKGEGSTDYDTNVQLRPADAENKPTTTVLEQQVMHESDLTANYVWQEFSFTQDHGLLLGEALCLVLQGTGNDSAYVQYEDNNEYGATGRVKTTNSGSSWEYKADRALRHEIYGKAAVHGPDQTATRQYVTGVQLALQSGTDADTRVDTAVNLPNAPELLSAVWELDFDTDPTVLNMNGDESNDWNLRQGGSIDPADLVNGIWYVSNGSNLELDTVPDSSFSELTTIDLRFRCTELSGNGGYFQINADYTGGNFMPIVMTLDKVTDVSQTAQVTTGGTTVVTESGLGTDFIDVRLLIDPNLNTVNIKMNEVNNGTFAYTPYPPASDPQCATLHELNSKTEWDYVRIRIGGNN